MAIFNRPDQQTSIKTDTPIISTRTRIKGTIESRCALHIDGAIDGIVKADGSVTIGQSGKIEGDLSANKLTVTGLFHGTADCEHVDIHEGGTLRGKVISNNLTIDQNCSFEGESVKKSAARQSHTQAKKNTETALPGSLKAS